MGSSSSKGSRDPDVERSQLLRTHIGGYGPAAALLASDPDGETLIFRRFEKLAAQNILYLQSELLMLEDKLEQMDQALLRSHNMKLRQSERRFEALTELLQSDNAEERRVAKERMDAIMDLRIKMEAYLRGNDTEDALIRQKKAARFDRPSSRALEALSAEFKGGELRPGGIRISTNPMLAGRAATYLDDDQDLVSLKSPDDTDLLSRFVQDNWPTQGQTSRQTAHRIGRYEEKRVKFAVSVISTLFATILLLGAVSTLSFVQAFHWKLVTLGGFTAAFAMALAIMSNAKRVDVFAATAAYCAVLVVFIGGTQSTPSSPA